MAGVDAVPIELSADARDVRVRLGIALLGPRADATEQPVLVELLRELGRDARAAAELVEVDLLDRIAKPARPPPLAVGGSGSGELVADHAQRQELVALEPQDRLEPFEVMVGEEAVAATRPLRADQAFVLEEADLRDRDVGELVAQPSDDLADPEEAFALRAVGGRTHRSKKVRRYLPICSSSPFSSTALSMRLRLTNVPFSDPWSSTEKRPSRSTRTAWLRETVTSSRKISQSGERPTLVRSRVSMNLSPALPPPERTTSAGPSSPSTGSPAASAASSASGLIVNVGSPESSVRSISAPQREQ